MKFRSTLFIAIIALFLAACNMSLAEDVTPPPGAAQPVQPQPTLGPLFPAQAPDVQNGAAIYAENCVACHGISGLSDGVMTGQLTAQDITVPMLGSAEVAQKVTPADWYQMVTLGNIENFMPPFNSLNEQQRWDVVAYAQSLSSAPEQINQGEELFNENCAECSTDFFTDLEGMAALSTNDLVSLLANGGEGIPALGNSLSEDELTAVALYLRTLTVPASAAAPEPAPVSEAPSAEETPADGEQAEVTPEADAEVAVIGSVSGKLLNASGGDVPAGMEVTLVGFEHTTDADGTPVEVVNETVQSDRSGVYLFEDVDISEGRIFLVETNYQGISFQSELAFTDGDTTELTVPDLALYESTTDSGGLVIEQLHISFDMAVENGVQVFELYTISNLSDKAYVFTTDGTSLPFMPLPEGAVNVGLELSQDSAPLMPTDDGFAILPSEDFYSIIAFFSMPYDNKLELSQPLALPVSSALIIVPEGIKVKADGLTDEGVQPTQQGFNIQMYSGSGLSAGSPLDMTLSGKIKSSGSDATVDNRQTLLIGAGAFGVVLILAGVWMFLRDRNKVDEDEFEEEDEENEFETAEEVMDAIIALDDLHRAKKIPDEAYQLRRAELKELLKELA
jgi:mono/diheme cytochrome c family protein